MPRRLADPNFMRDYFRGEGIDVGGAPDPLALYVDVFPAMTAVRTWDREDGDAQLMAGVADQSVDFVHASHVLEHMVDPAEALASWMRILRPGGHLVVTVPDEDLYEQGVFPSTFNSDHKWTFAVFKTASWSPRSKNLVDLVTGLGAAADVRRLMVIDAAHRYRLPRTDQTITPVDECAIELVVRRRPPCEIAAKGRLPGAEQPAPLLRRHFNQYHRDKRAARAANPETPPFADEGAL